MRLRRGFIGGIAILALALGGIATAGEEDVTMTGRFVWERSDKHIPGDLYRRALCQPRNRIPVAPRSRVEGDPHSQALCEHSSR